MRLKIPSHRWHVAACIGHIANSRSRAGALVSSSPSRDTVLPVITGQRMTWWIAVDSETRQTARWRWMKGGGDKRRQGPGSGRRSSGEAAKDAAVRVPQQLRAPALPPARTGSCPLSAVALSEHSPSALSLPPSNAIRNVLPHTQLLLHHQHRRHTLPRRQEDRRGLLWRHLRGSVSLFALAPVHMPIQFLYRDELAQFPKRRHQVCAHNHLSPALSSHILTLLSPTGTAQGRGSPAP